MYSISPYHLRFAFKLAFAIVLALFVGFHFQLETPRWAVLTAAIVAAGPAFAAGGEPYSGAIRYRGMLRIIGTFIGCIAALIIITTLIRAPIVMLLVCCIWAGFCTWISSLVKVENSYAWGLSGYTALIIIVTIQANPVTAPQFAVERCSEIVIGIVCAILADLIFSPRSIKQEIDRELDNLLVDQYRLMQLCIAHGDKEEVDKSWANLVRRTTALEGMRSNLKIESSRWGQANRRLKAINTLSLTLITQAGETYLIQNTRPEFVTPEFKMLFEMPVETAADVHKQMKRLRRFISSSGEKHTPVTISSWAGAATRFLLLKRGIASNTRINAVEEEVLSGETVVKVHSAERHHAMINFWRTTIACGLGSLFWLWTGWTSGSGAMVMIAVVTSLAMRLPNPRMVSLDFLYGMLVALPLGALYFLVIIPSTQQSMLLLCISLALLGFFIGIEVQKRRLGSMGALAGTINVIVLDNPMTFHFSSFLDSALGQIVGCFLAMMVILLVRDNSKDRTGRTLLNQFVSAAVSALTTNKARRKENHLPALYQQLYLLLNMFPGDIARYRLALILIIAHQRLRDAPIPVNADLSAFHRQLRNTADQVISASNDDKRRKYFLQLLGELEVYQEKLRVWEAPLQVTEPVKRLADVLHRYQHALIDA
ncbi:p-hydroxybenzoic acid efflux pump subunit AaeB [Enterobacteriaceae bacterium H11S18]|uniref:p-hydroxybenzoic acid efflux pump subunit AaeB n=1 Tax=Dryocola clanedunensis TaxID=2925396 RepID=UPI0022F01124|nr:p-hydroxybenzoic acid efflux pump subunit AaeB [Dryocola clanedunensis]MCT4705477.1 p-hydroxybenzoic acid efflux pump subunit AaeB [Dryocola clanedunensis]MCT4710051.1 p-hydroxybenzoic acid efflux pump subunit AaeB [Dryocola clanedunensis]